MKTFKNLLIALFATLCGINAYALSFNHQGLEFTTTADYDDYSTVKLSGVFISKSCVVVPDEIIYKDRKYLVTAIDNGVFANNITLEEIELPKQNINRIPERCFANTKNLKKITLPESLISIGESAFEKSGLNSIDIPDGVTEIGECAFASTSLTTIVLPPNITKIAKNLFEFSQLQNVVIPENVTEIGECAFRFTSLEKIDLSASVRYIGKAAFTGCHKIESFHIGENIEYLGSEFISSKKLKQLTFSENHNIQSFSIGKCESLEYIDLTPLKSLKIIDRACFSDCEALKDIILPNTLEEIGFRAFYNCVNLKKINLPSSLKYIDAWAFQNCESLEELILPKLIQFGGFVEYQGGHTYTVAIENAKSLKKLVIPAECFSASVSIAENLNRSFFGGNFSESEELEEIVVNMLNPELFCSYYLWFSSSTYQNAVLRVPVGTRERYRASIDWGSFDNIVEDPDVVGVEVVAGVEEVQSETEDITIDGRCLRVNGDTDVYIKIYDISGKCALEVQTVNGVADLSDLSSGLYIAVAKSSKGNAAKKFILHD